MVMAILVMKALTIMMFATAVFGAFGLIAIGIWKLWKDG